MPAHVSAKPRGPAYLAAVLAIAGWFVAAALASYMLRAGARGEGGLFFSSIAALSTERPVGVAFGPLALSPDGTRLAMLVDRGGDRISISVYDFRNGSATVLEDTKGAGFPFWSPDSRWIAFFSDGKLRKVEASGGPAQSLADALAGRGGSWGRTGVIVFAPDIRGPMMKVSENGGAPTVVTKPASEDITHRNPLFLPDGRRFLFIERRSREETVGRLMAGALDGAAPREVLEQASNVQIADGYLLFVRNQSLLAQRFDATSLSLSGPIVPVAENIAYWNPRDIGDFSVAPTGLLAFRHQAVAEGSLAWFDHDGRPLDVLGSKERLVGVIPSHDLRQVALVRPESSGLDIWLLDLRSKQRTRVTFTNTPAVMNCAFSPDGQRLAVSAENQGAGSGSSALRIQPVSGAHGVEKLLEKTDFIVQSWSPDGKVLLGHAQRPGTGFDITYVRLDDPKHEVRDLVRTQFIETTPSFSPDGAWVAYKSDESGREEVYLVDFPNAAHKVQVSRDGVRLSIDGGRGRAQLVGHDRPRSVGSGRGPTRPHPKSTPVSSRPWCSSPRG